MGCKASGTSRVALTDNANLLTVNNLGTPKAVFKGDGTLISNGNFKALTGKGLYVNSIQVVSDQGAAVADATDAASAITQLNALLSRCRTHGLIAT
jgi:hypothetical protein